MKTQSFVEGDTQNQMKSMERKITTLNHQVTQGHGEAIYYFIPSERMHIRETRSVDTTSSMDAVPLWRIAIGHHPFYSASTHGYNSDFSKLLPFLRKNKVTVMMSGHENSLQYLKLPDDSLHQIISSSDPYMKASKKETGFIYVHLSRDFLDVSIVNLFGRVTNHIKIHRQT